MITAVVELNDSHSAQRLGRAASRVANSNEKTSLPFYHRASRSKSAFKCATCFYNCTTYVGHPNDRNRQLSQRHVARTTN